MDCPKPIKGVALRITRADECGNPIADTEANSRVATDGFIRLAMTPDYDDGEEILVKNANGTICLHDAPSSSLKGVQLELELCGVPFAVLEMLTGHVVLTRTVGENTVAVGLGSPIAYDTSEQNAILEVWQRNKSAECSEATDDLYVQWAVALTNKWRITSGLEFADAATLITLSGYGERNPNFDSPETGEWGAADVTAIQQGRVWAMQLTGSIPDNLDTCDYAPAAV